MSQTPELHGANPTIHGGTSPTKQGSALAMTREVFWTIIPTIHGGVYTKQRERPALAVTRSYKKKLIILSVVEGCSMPIVWRVTFFPCSENAIRSCTQLTHAKG